MKRERFERALKRAKEEFRECEHPMYFSDLSNSGLAKSVFQFADGSGFVWGVCEQNGPFGGPFSDVFGGGLAEAILDESGEEAPASRCRALLADYHEKREKLRSKMEEERGRYTEVIHVPLRGASLFPAVKADEELEAAVRAAICPLYVAEKYYLCKKEDGTECVFYDKNHPVKIGSAFVRPVAPGTLRAIEPLALAAARAHNAQYYPNNPTAWDKIKTVRVSNSALRMELLEPFYALA